MLAPTAPSPVRDVTLKHLGVAGHLASGCLAHAASRRQRLLQGLFRHSIAGTHTTARRGVLAPHWSRDTTPAINVQRLSQRLDCFAATAVAPRSMVAHADARDLHVPRVAPTSIASTSSVRCYEEGCPTHWSRTTLLTADSLNAVLDSNASAQAFVDRTLSYCFLCDEPVANVDTHSGYWDHVNRFVALRLAASYIRDWQPEAVLLDACLVLQPTTLVRLVPGWLLSKWTLPRLVGATRSFGKQRRTPLQHRSTGGVRNDLWGSTEWTCAPTSVLDEQAGSAAAAMEPVASRRRLAHLTHCLRTPGLMPPPSMAPALADVEASTRRDTLTALLVRLCTWRVLDYAFVGAEERPGAVNQGERSFRATMSELMTPMMPPMSAQAMTRWHQKCFGRQSLALLFDVLCLEAVCQRGLFGAQNKDVARTKEAKAAVMRQTLYQLHCAIDGCGVPATTEKADTATMRPEPVGRDGSGLQRRPTARSPLPVPPPCVVAALCEVALHKTAFELVNLRTSMLMDETAGGMWATLGFPVASDLEGSSLAR